jgi:small-conductance mechanosensitive channel
MKASWVLRGAAIVTMVWLILLLPACAPAPPTPTPTSPPVSDDTAESNPSSQPTQESDSGVAGIPTAVAARTPIPTPTPNRIERRVDSLAESMGLGGATLLGLEASDWAELAGSVLIVVIGYFIARVLVNTILKRIVGRTHTKLDDEIFSVVNSKLRWLVILIFAEYAFLGLSFLGDTFRTRISDLFFLLWLFILTSVVLGSIRVATNHYKATQATQEEDMDRLDPVIMSVQRFAYFIVIMFALSIGLAHFGVNSNTLLLILLVTALIISLAGKDIIADVLSGFIILVDQPFREGDSVLISELDTWGDVLDIGARTTRIRTKDNRELIVPNSQVAKSRIVNYNYPDTNYRLQTEIGIAYGIDFDHIQKSATEAVRNVDGVLADKPVDVFFIEFGDSARKVRVRWWIASFHNQWPVINGVNIALESAFEKAQIDMPYNTYALRVHMENEVG